MGGSKTTGGFWKRLSSKEPPPPTPPPLGEVVLAFEEVLADSGKGKQWAPLMAMVVVNAKTGQTKKKVEEVGDIRMSLELHGLGGLSRTPEEDDDDSARDSDEEDFVDEDTSDEDHDEEGAGGSVGSGVLPPRRVTSSSRETGEVSVVKRGSSRETGEVSVVKRGSSRETGEVSVVKRGSSVESAMSSSEEEDSGEAASDFVPNSVSIAIFAVELDHFSGSSVHVSVVCPQTNVKKSTKAPVRLQTPRWEKDGKVPEVVFQPQDLPSMDTSSPSDDDVLCLELKLQNAFKTLVGQLSLNLTAEKEFQNRHGVPLRKVFILRDGKKNGNKGSIQLEIRWFDTNHPDIGTRRRDQRLLQDRERLQLQLQLQRVDATSSSGPEITRSVPSEGNNNSFLDHLPEIQTVVRDDSLGGGNNNSDTFYDSENESLASMPDEEDVVVVKHTSSNPDDRNGAMIVVDSTAKSMDDSSTYDSFRDDDDVARSKEDDSSHSRSHGGVTLPARRYDSHHHQENGSVDGDSDHELQYSMDSGDRGAASRHSSSDGVDDDATQSDASQAFNSVHTKVLF
jgi:hypothetical protein